MRRRCQVTLSIIFIWMLLLTACGKYPYEELRQEPDLVVYTPLTEDIYRPIIREFEERNGLLVEVHQEMEEEIIEELRGNRNQFSGDVILGISKAAVLDYKQLFPEKRNFSSSSFVIIYNRNIVMYNEIPQDFNSLLDEKWAGQIGFLDPSTSNTAKDILQFIKDHISDKTEGDLHHFYDNMRNQYAQTLEEISKGVCDGKYSVGVVTKGNAESLIADGHNIEYINLAKDDCVISNMVVTTLNKKHVTEADDFLDFVTGDDMQNYLTQYLKYRAATEE